MADYIERQAALELAMAYAPDDDGSCSKAGEDIRNLLDELESIPPADVRPVVRGEWKQYRKGIDLQCSRCYWSSDVISTLGIPLNFCPNCGSYNGGDFSVDE